MFPPILAVLLLVLQYCVLFYCC